MTDNDFRFLKSAVDLDDPQRVSNALCHVYDVMQQLDEFNRERAIIKSYNSMHDAWMYVSRPDRRQTIVRVQNKPRKLHSLVELVLKPLVNKKSTMVEWIESYISKYFLMFIQGITLFASDGNDIGPNIGKPAYHRTASCGPKHADATYALMHLNCTGINEIEELQRRRRNSWNCFIERRVYQEMYIYLRGLAEQNYGHMFQMRHIQENVFETCYPLMHINVSSINVTWSIDAIPIAMELTYNTRMPHDGEFYTVVEKYTRTFSGTSYSSGVSCERTVISPDATLRETMFKTQSFFEKTEEWIGSRPLRGGSATSSPMPIQDPWIVAIANTRPPSIRAMQRMFSGA